MVEVKQYQLPPTKLIPNSPRCLLHYPNFFSTQADRAPDSVHNVFTSNGWDTQWIFRYGATQASHYHSRTHECMAVLSGTATIRFGVADLVDESIDDSNKEDGGIELHASAGDVFVLPAGLAHKTFDAQPFEEFKLLTPGDGHHIAARDPKAALASLQLSGFTMIGAYPRSGGEWDFAKGGESEGNYDQVWSVPKPESDPVLGRSEEGLCGQWKQ